MFGNNPFLSKKDPLLEAVKQAQADGAMRRQAEAIVNENFDVYSRNAVIRENLAAYDAAIEEVYGALKEGTQIDEISKELAGRYAKKAYAQSRSATAQAVDAYHNNLPKTQAYHSDKSNKRGAGMRLAIDKLSGRAKVSANEETDYSAQDRAPVTKSAPKEDPSTPKSYPGAASSAPTADRLSNAKAAVTPVKEDDYSSMKTRSGNTIPESNKLAGGVANPKCNGVTAPKEWAMKAKTPNKNAVTKAPVPGVSIKESIIAKLHAKYMKEDSSFNAAQVTGKSVNEVAVDMPPPPTSAYHAPAKPGNPAAQVKLRAPTGMQGARQVTNSVKPSSVSVGNVKPSLSYGMSQSSAPKLGAAGPRAGVGGLGGASGAGVARSLAGTLARGAVGAAVTAAAPVLGKAMQQSHQSGHSATPGVSAHPSTPGVSAQKTLSGMRKIEAPNARPATPTKELNPNTTGTPAKLGAYNSAAGPDATKFTGGAKPAAGAPVKQSFSQAYQAARAAAGSKANFSWGGKSFQAAAKKSEYVAPSKQVKTDTATATTPTSAPAPKDVPTIKAPSTPAKIAAPPVAKPEPSPTASPAPSPAPAATAPKATAPSWADQEKAIKNTPAPSSYVPDAAKVGRTDSDVAPKSAPAPEKTGSEKEGEKKMKSLGLDESFISVGVNKYRIV